MYQLKVVCMAELNSLDAAIFLSLNDVLLSDDCEVRLMCEQTQHD